MKRLAVVGGLAFALAAMALQHSPPAQDHVMALKAPTPVVALAPSVLSAPTMDLTVVKVVVGQHILVPSASLRNLRPIPRPSWRVDHVALTNIANINTRSRYVADMRGWGFL